MHGNTVRATAPMLPGIPATTAGHAPTPAQLTRLEAIEQRECAYFSRLSRMEQLNLQHIMPTHKLRSMALGEQLRRIHNQGAGAGCLINGRPLGEIVLACGEDMALGQTLLEVLPAPPAPTLRALDPSQRTPAEQAYYALLSDASEQRLGRQPPLPEFSALLVTVATGLPASPTAGAAPQPAMPLEVIEQREIAYFSRLPRTEQWMIGNTAPTTTIRLREVGAQLQDIATRRCSDSCSVNGRPLADLVRQFPDALDLGRELLRALPDPAMTARMPAFEDYATLAYQVLLSDAGGREQAGIEPRLDRAARLVTLATRPMPPA